MKNFNEMSIADNIKLAINDMGFDSPTPIQDEVIPLIIEGRDIIAQAPTGTGKTCAFGIPVINNISTEAEAIQALILCPTRELVIQTEAELKEVAKFSKNIRIVSIYGGQNFDRQLAGLRKRPQIIVGTTGRVMDHLRRKSLKLQDLKILILDEVDEMLNMGFREDIDVILESVPKERQTVLFSATMPKEIVNISKLYQTDPISIKTQHMESDIPNINQYYIKVSESEKINALKAVVKEKNYKLVLVFCNTKKRVDELSAIVNDKGISADALHGDLRQHQRDKTMKRFRSGEIQMLIATDVAARGLDVDDIDAVFNFDVPHDEEVYVHRIGRTARAKKIGDAYTFFTEKQMYALRSFEGYVKSPILKYSFLKQAPETSIDKKLFDKTLKLIKKSDLTTYKEFLISELEKFQEKYEDVNFIDIAAALLMQMTEEGFNKALVLSEAPKLAMKEKRLSSRRNDGVRFFMNIGTRDKCDEDSLPKYITSKTAILASDILSVKCLENYSFVNVTKDYKEDMESLNGLKYNKRILAVEVASNNGASKGNKPENKSQRVFQADMQQKAKKSGSPRSKNKNSAKPEGKMDNNLTDFMDFKPFKKGKKR